MTPPIIGPTIGWIGTGRMGYQLALRLLNAGHDVTVWNRTRSKAEPLAEAGAKIADRPASLADRNIVFVMVSADTDLETVISGEGGLLTSGRAPKIIVDSSTVSPAAASSFVRRSRANNSKPWTASSARLVRERIASSPTPPTRASVSPESWAVDHPRSTTARPTSCSKRRGSTR